MQTLFQPCESFGLTMFVSSQSPNTFSFVHKTAVPNKHVTSITKYPLYKTMDFSFLRSAHIVLCSQKDAFGVFLGTQFPEKVENDGVEENEELELLNKPNLVPMSNEIASEVDEEPDKIDEERALAPFLKFFKPRDSVEEEIEEQQSKVGVSSENIDVDNKVEEAKKVIVEYYEPEPGDFVVGVVVSGNENKLYMNVGADLLGTMLTKEVLPLYDKEMEYLVCDLKKDAEEFMVRGKMGIVKDDDAMSGGSGPGRPIVETGTVLFAEVLGRTLSGWSLLSTRQLFRKMAWHRVRQIKQLNQPIEVKITEWNTGDLLTRIEGLRAFLPKAELLNRVNNFTELKENVGRQIYVQITRINEANNDLILSEREAWAVLNLRDGTLLDGTVKKIFPYGAQIRIGDTNRSIADLESEPGLFISNKERVFSEAEEMAKKYRQKMPAISLSPKSEPPPTDGLPFDREASMCANWKWFKFESNK